MKHKRDNRWEGLLLDTLYHLLWGTERRKGGKDIGVFPKVNLGKKHEQ